MSDADYLLAFLHDRHIPLVTKNRHTYLAYCGCEQSYTYVLEQGIVKTSIILHDGREFNIAYLNAPDIISLLRDEVSRYTTAPYNVRIETQYARFYQVERVSFWEFVNNDVRLQQYVKDYYRNKLSESIYRQQLMTMNGKLGAVCGFLMMLNKRFGVTTPEGSVIDLTVTNEDIAGFCGISTRNSVNRIMHDLKKDDIIEIDHQRVLIRNISALSDLVGE